MKFLYVFLALLVVLFGTTSATICATDQRSGGPQNFDSLGAMYAENGRGGHVLPLYIVDALHYEENETTVFYHTFSMFIFLFSMIGGMLTDSWLGKFRSLIYFSIFFVIGLILLSVSSISSMHLPVRHCTSDYIAVYAGPTTNSALLKTLCEKQKASVSHIGKDLLVEFRSGSEVAPFDYNGFVAKLTFVEITTEAPTTTTAESTSKAPEMIRSPGNGGAASTASSNGLSNSIHQQANPSQPQRNGNQQHHSRGGKEASSGAFTSAGCDVEVSGERLRMGWHSTRGRGASAAASSTCRLSLLGRDYDTVHVALANYNLSTSACKSQIEVFDGLLDDKGSMNAKSIGKICGPASESQHQKQISPLEYTEKKRYSSSSRNMTIVLTRATNEDYMDVSFYFHNERESGTQQPKTFCDFEYYGKSSPRTGTVVHPKANRFNAGSGNDKCKQHFIPAANQAVIITLNSTMNQTHDSRCTTQCGDKGCRCASDELLDNVDHLLLISQTYGNTLACLCGNNRDWLPVEFWSTTPVYIEWSRAPHAAGLNLTAEYKFAEDSFCGGIHEVERPDGEVHAGYAHNFSFALNHYYQQKCTYVIDSPPGRELVIYIESSQTRPCSAWNLTVHEYNKTSANPEGPRAYTFCPRDIARNFTIAPEIRSVMVKLQALGRTAPQYVLKWRSYSANSTMRSRDSPILTGNVALASASARGVLVGNAPAALALLIAPLLAALAT